MYAPATACRGTGDLRNRIGEQSTGPVLRHIGHRCNAFQVASRREGRLIRPQRLLGKCLASAEPEVKGQELESGWEQNPDSEQARKKAEADRLRAAEKFMVVGTGEAVCTGCGFEYTPKKGDPEYPIAPGVFFKDLPEDWNCPICGAPKEKFSSRAFEVAGFAENQKYGLGTNSMTSGQKSILIFGSLFFFFLLFIGGYFID